MRMNIRYLQVFFRLLFYLKNWWVFYFDYLGLLGRQIVIYKLTNGINLYAKTNQGEGIILYEIWVDKVYNPDVFTIKKTDVVVDIGAHKGYFSILASLYASEGKVFSFEPVSENYEMLKNNLLLNQRKNVYPYRLAVTGSTGRTNLYTNLDNSGGVSIIKQQFYKDTERNQKVIRIPVRSITLEDIFSITKIKKIDFLKIDCEGAEYDIFFNTSKSVMKKINKISMEYHENSRFRAVDLETFLKKMGFIVRIVPQNKSIGLLYAEKML